MLRDRLFLGYTDSAPGAMQELVRKSWLNMICKQYTLASHLWQMKVHSVS